MVVVVVVVVAAPPEKGVFISEERRGQKSQTTEMSGGRASESGSGPLGLEQSAACVQCAGAAEERKQKKDYLRPSVGGKETVWWQPL